ncbi:MAG TPA: helix-turn-helix domain-containing protein [Trebonia sp.]|nr:helix-turn-helix domain-containing protein [Trebonia sp.]
MQALGDGNDQAAQGSARAVASAGPSQTLSRGLSALEVIAGTDQPIGIAELAARLGLHRSITYRIVRTLEEHRLVVRTPSGGLVPGTRLAALARAVARDLQSAALPELTAVANELGMTAFVAVLDADEVIALVSVEPRHAVAPVAQRPGTRHPLHRGAPGAAIQAALTPQERAALGDERLRDETFFAAFPGYATSHDEVIKGMSSVAVPLRVSGQPAAAIAVVYLDRSTDAAAVGERLGRAAAAVIRELA